MVTAPCQPRNERGSGCPAQSQARACSEKPSSATALTAAMAIGARIRQHYGRPADSSRRGAEPTLTEVGRGCARCVPSRPNRSSLSALYRCETWQYGAAHRGSYQAEKGPARGLHEAIRTKEITLRNLTTKQRVTSGAIALLVLGVVGLAYAAWTSNGTGSGYAKAGSAQDLSTVDVSASTTATLYPGADGDVLIRIQEPEPVPGRGRPTSTGTARSPPTRAIRPASPRGSPTPTRAA